MPGRIGSKSIEIMTTKFDQIAILCTGSEFTPIFTSSIDLLSLIQHRRR